MIEFRDIVTPVHCLVTEKTTLRDALGFFKKEKWNLFARDRCRAEFARGFYSERALPNDTRWQSA